MQRRDLIIGVVVLIIIATIVLFVQRRRQEVSLPTPTPTTPTIEEQEQELEDRFKLEIPEDVEKASLRDTQNRGFSAIATRDFSGGVFTLTVLADLPDPEANEFYQVWLRKASETRKIGTMSVAKGGFLLDTSLREDLTAFDEVVVSSETVNDSQVEEVVLQGSF